MEVQGPGQELPQGLPGLPPGLPPGPPGLPQLDQPNVRGEPEASPKGPPGPPQGLWGESLLATIGIRSFLARETRKILVSDHDQAHRLPAAISTEVRAFLAGESTKPTKGDTFDYLKVLGELGRPVNPIDIENMIGDHRESGDALDMMVPLTKALDYLSTIAPRRVKQDLFDAETIRPSDQEVGRFRRAFDIVNDPMTVLRRLRTESLLGDEVTALQTVYPVLYEEIQTRVVRAFGEMVARRPKFKLTYHKDRVLRILLQTGKDPGLVGAMQASFSPEAQPEAPAAPRGGKINLKSHSFQTTGQTVEAGGKR